MIKINIYLMKKKISNSEELNKYYNIVNNKIKKFTDMDIPGNDIFKYLKPGTSNFNKFISDDDDLKDVDGIEIILKDIVNDTYAAFKDGLLKKVNKSIKKFENFSSKMYELDSDIREHEKAIADIYRISLTYIEPINMEKHLFKINDHGEIKKILIFTEKEILNIKEQLVNKLLDNTFKNRTIPIKVFNVDKQIPIDKAFNEELVKKFLYDELKINDVINAIEFDNSDINLKFKHISNRTLNSIEYYLFEAI